MPLALAEVCQGAWRELRLPGQELPSRCSGGALASGYSAPSQEASEAGGFLGLRRTRETLNQVGDLWRKNLSLGFFSLLFGFLSQNLIAPITLGLACPDPTLASRL